MKRATCYRNTKERKEKLINEQHFFQNYLQTKHKQSKTITKDMSKSEL